MKKDERVNVRINEAEKAELEAIGEKLDVPVSQIVREAVRERIAVLREQVKETSLQN